MSTYQENLDNLNRSYELVKANNPDAHILITVSPVPLRATFRPINSVIADTAGKSMLRAVVDEFVRTRGDDVTYFPAYEVVRCLTETPWKSDARHVTRDIVASIMSLFEEWFVKERTTLSADELYEQAEASFLNRDFAQAAIQFEELVAGLNTNPGLLGDEKTVNWRVFERLAMTYYQVQRYGEAYELLLKTIELKPQDSERWDDVLSNVCALAISMADYERVPSLLSKLLMCPTAPLGTFFHWIKLLEAHRGADTAKTVLNDGLNFAPRVSSHPEFPDYASRLGLALAS
jgi:tetratricopeptide (TPR) repeat protein